MPISKIDTPALKADAVDNTTIISNLGGNVRIGKGSWIGIGSSIIQGIKIGEEVLLGAGSVVIKDLPDTVKAVGNPAKIIKK